MPRIEHLAIYADDAPSLKRFYEDAFGMRTVRESGGNPPGYFLVDSAGFAIEIIGRPSGKTGANQRWVCHFAFWVDDFPAACQALRDRGIALEDDTYVDNDEIRTAFFNDPESNRCQIIWRKQALGD
jgi:glyoxylase I family protein